MINAKTMTVDAAIEALVNAAKPIDCIDGEIHELIAAVRADQSSIERARMVKLARSWKSRGTRTIYGHVYSHDDFVSELRALAEGGE